MPGGSRTADGFDFLEQRALEIEVFDDRFDDPVNFGEPLEVVLEVSDRDQARERWVEEGGRLGLFCGFESGGGNLIARGAVGVGRNDIEEIAGDSGVGKVGSDAGTHGAGAEDGDFMNAFHRGAQEKFTTLDCSCMSGEKFIVISQFCIANSGRRGKK